jgi:hypothetical protein
MGKNMQMSTAMSSAVNIISIVVLVFGLGSFCIIQGIESMIDATLSQNVPMLLFGLLLFISGVNLVHCAALTGSFGIIASGVAFAFSENRKGVIISSDTLFKFTTEIFVATTAMSFFFSLSIYGYLITDSDGFLYIGLFLLAAFDIAMSIKVIADSTSTGLGKSRFYQRSNAFPIEDSTRLDKSRFRLDKSRF